MSTKNNDEFDDIAPAKTMEELQSQAAQADADHDARTAVHPLTTSGVDLMRRFRDAQHDVIEWTIRVRQAMDRGELRLPQLVDACWLLMQDANSAEHVRRETNVLREILAKACCAAWVAMCAADPEVDARVTGEIAIGTPTSGQGVNVPDRKSPDYIRFLRAFGIPEALLSADVVRPHWPGLCAELDRRAERGAPLPPGIPADQVYPTFRLVALTLKKGVNLDEVR